MARRHKIHQRERRVHTAAAVAAEGDAAFDSDTVHEQAAKLFLDIQTAWDTDDRAALKQLVGPELWDEWQRRLQDFARKGWHNHVQPLGPPKIEYVGLHNAADPSDDRVVVIVEARVRDYVETSSGQRITHRGTSSDIINAFEYWTLGKRTDKEGNTHWILLSIEQPAEGAHELREELVPTPEYDEQAMRDEAMVEGAAAEAVPEGTKIAELADLDFQGDARAAANDLSLADGRFAPDILEVAARRAVNAWAQAIDGDRSDLAGDRRPALRPRAAAPRRPERQDATRGARPARDGTPDHRTRRADRSADDAARGPAGGRALHRGSRHDRSRVREPDARRPLHRALDDGALGRQRPALADHRRRDAGARVSSAGSTASRLPRPAHHLPRWLSAPAFHPASIAR